MRKLSLIVKENPKSPASEAFRMLRTNIQFSNIDKNIKSIMFTSTDSSQGKSTVSSNYAMSLIQNGKKVCVVDCDLRKPMQHKIFEISNSYGLTNYVVEDILLDSIIQNTEFENLDIITSGPTPPNPSELLGSKSIKYLFEELKKRYDFIVVDTPPVNYVTDAAVIGRILDGAVLVLTSGETPKSSLKNATELLERVGVNTLGIVLNKIQVNTSYYYRYYNKYYY
jgi:capsular exopolysaccharide synthesis family protein